MILGVRAHDFGKLPPEELAEKISGKDFSCVQLALTKAVSGINIGSGSLTPGLAHYLKEIFAGHRLQIAVLGCYINPVTPDQADRGKQLDRFKEHLRYARDFGCGMVATETGSVNPDCSFHPENQSEKSFQILVESIGELVVEAEKFGVLVGIEGVTSHVVSTPARMKRVLDAVASNNLQVVFDPVNFLNIDNHHNQEQIIEEAFQLFGDRIVIVHAKDFRVDNGQFRIVEAGKGRLNYELIIKTLKERKPYINVLLEGCKVETMDESVRFLRGIFGRRF